MYNKKEKGEINEKSNRTILHRLHSRLFRRGMLSQLRRVQSVALRLLARKIIVMHDFKT